MVNSRYVNCVIRSRRNGHSVLAATPKCRYMSTTSSTSDDYQYMQNSKLPTMHFQRSLPRLPIPKLELTCERFLAAIKPISSPEEFESTQQVVEAFRQDFKHAIGMS